MKKLCLLAGVFILTSSSPSSAQHLQMVRVSQQLSPQFHSLSNSNLRTSFYHWKNVQQDNAEMKSFSFSVNSPLATSYNSSLNVNSWPRVSNKDQGNGYNALTGFAQGFSSGYSATNSYYLKDGYHGELNKNLYSVGSFFVGAGVGALLGAKNTRHRFQ